ncbi:hypothetical protein F511_10951 [Dorcoceras hygrometricum]|uniref:Uncharacterized protein n=1 Tax=Dorcoceras hygrometricum TaxID=472368 RepID=A0A2Z7AA87_9LAMI|nr:hypothetical protein F511_10951 [Dorcoceras hygrometricum]
MAEESTKSWADTESDSSSSSSSSSDSEQEEVHCLMADKTSDDEPASDRTGLGFNSSETSEGETSTQSRLVYDKFNKMSFVKANVIYDPCESMKYDDQTSHKLNHKPKAGIGFQRPENSNPSWLKKKLDKDKAKAGSKSFVPNQPRRNSTKVKSGWRKVQPRRDLNGQNMKSTLNRSHRNFAQTLTDSSTGKTVKAPRRQQASRHLAPTSFTRKLALQRLAVVVLRIRSTTGNTIPSSVCTRRADEFTTNGISSSWWSEQVQPRRRRHTAATRRRVRATAERKSGGEGRRVVGFGCDASVSPM